jgi:hypothetical protein
MIRVALSVVLLLSLEVAGASSAQAPPPGPAAPPKGEVFKGVIQDVRGIFGTLTLRPDGAPKQKDRSFRIDRARIVGPTGLEWKIGDLQVNDRVEVVMTADGRTVQEVRVTKPYTGRISPPRR